MARFRHAGKHGVVVRAGNLEMLDRRAMPSPALGEFARLAAELVAFRRADGDGDRRVGRRLQVYGADAGGHILGHARSEEHTSELQSLMRISYAVFCLKKKKKNNTDKSNTY